MENRVEAMAAKRSAHAIRVFQSSVKDLNSRKMVLKPPQVGIYSYQPRNGMPVQQQAPDEP